MPLYDIREKVQNAAIISVHVAGTLAAATTAGVPSIIRIPKAGKIIKVYGDVETAPTGADILTDVNINGTTIFTTQANRLKIADGTTEGVAETIEAGLLSAGDKITVDLDQVGSGGTEGADLTVNIVIE